MTTLLKTKDNKTVLTMNAAIMNGAYDIQFGEVVKPIPSQDEVLIQVKANSVCGSDIHYYHDGGIGATTVNKGFVPGHEFAGIIVEGSGEAHGFSDGTLVAVDPNQPCYACELCHAGNHHMCLAHIFVGAPPTQGGMAEYIAVPASSLHCVPENFTAQQAALLEPLGIAIHALDLAKLRPASNVAIHGAGTIGLYILMLAKISGAAQTFVIEPLAYRREIALRLGATKVFENVAAYMEYSNSVDGADVDVAIEATTSPDGPDQATQVVKVGGKVILVGIPDGDTFSLTASMVRRKGLTLKMSRRMNHVYPRAIQLVESGLIDVNAIVTHVLPLKDVHTAFELMSKYDDGVVKVVLEP